MGFFFFLEKYNAENEGDLCALNLTVGLIRIGAKLPIRIGAKLSSINDI